MSWNYRVCKETTSGEFDNGEKWENISYAIHEVYYDAAGEVCANTEDPIAVVTDTAPGTGLETEEECVAVLAEKLEMMAKALTVPVIDLDTIVYADWDEMEPDEEDDEEDEEDEQGR